MAHEMYRLLGTLKVTLAENHLTVYYLSCGIMCISLTLRQACHKSWMSCRSRPCQDPCLRVEGLGSLVIPGIQKLEISSQHGIMWNRPPSRISYWYGKGSWYRIICLFQPQGELQDRRQPSASYVLGLKFLNFLLIHLTKCNLCTQTAQSQSLWLQYGRRILQ